MNSVDNTMRITGEEVEEATIKAMLTKVYKALKDKGYNPINQIAGYLLSGDPAYITSYCNARALINQIDRDEIIRHLVRGYLR